ncbi:hypothetical protein J437_LFUL004359, partial [Ladona fulva]
MIDTVLEQRIIIKFLVKLRKTPIESFKLMKDVYGESVLSKETVFEWHKQFSEGREDTQDDIRSVRPTTEKSDEIVEKVRQLIRSNRRITTRVIAVKLGLSKETVRRIITVNLSMKKEDFTSKAAEAEGELSEDSEAGEWGDAGLGAAAESVEQPVSKEQLEANLVVVKQEVMDTDDDYGMDDHINSGDENGGYDDKRDTSWENSSNVRIGSNHANKDHIPKAVGPDREMSEGSDVGDWDDTEHGETESVEKIPREEQSIHGVVVKQEVMDEEVEDEYIMDESFNSAADENGEFQETEEPPWDKSPSLDDIPVAVEAEEDTSSNQVAYNEFETTDVSDRPRDRKEYICHYCNQSFLKQRQLYGHMAMHSRKGNYSKATTSKETPQNRNVAKGRSAMDHSRPMAKVRSWLQVQQAQMKFTCIDCYEEFIGVGKLTSHKGAHRQKDKKFHCSVCNYIYPRAVDLIFHEWTYHTGDRPFPCDRCPSAFARQTSWTYHILAHINNGTKFPSGRMRISPSSQPPPVSPPLESPPKSEVVTRRSVTPRRAAIEGRAATQMGVSATISGSYPFKCRTCGKGILNEESWEYHLVIHPNGGETRQDLSPKDLERLRTQLRTTLTCENKAKIVCLQCGLEIQSLQGLSNHKSEQHLMKGGYRCAVCFKMVENVQKFIRHEMSHTKLKIYICEMCGREMADRMSFIHHIICHFKEQQNESQPNVAKSVQTSGSDGVKREDVKEESFDQLVQRLLVPIKARLKQELVPCLQCGQVFEGIQ